MRAKRIDAKTRKILGNVTRRRSLRKVTRMKSKRRRSLRKMTRRRPLGKVARITRSLRRNVKKVPIPLRRRRPLRKMAPMMSAKKMKLDPTQHVGILSNLIQ